MRAIRWALRRVGRKLASLAPTAAGAVAVFGVLWLLMIFIRPRLPAEWQHTLARLENGEVAEVSDEFKAVFADSGAALEIAFLGLQVLQVVIAPIPGQLAGFVGGYLFGFWYGLLLTMTGLAVGSLIAMLLGRLLGKQVLRKFMPTGLIEKFDKVVGKDGLWSFFLIFLLPVLPDDAACFLAGLTRLSLWKLMLVCLAGRLPGMAVLTYVGYVMRAGAGGTGAYVVFGIAMVLSVVVWLFSEEFEQWFVRRFQQRTDAPPPTEPPKTGTQAGPT